MKYMVFAVAALGVPPLAVLLSMNMRWMKYAFWGMAAALVLYQNTSINFFSHEMYPGSSRGMEVSLVYLLDAAIVLAAKIRRKTQPFIAEKGFFFYLFYFALCLPSLSQADDGLIAWFEVWKMIMLFFHLYASYTCLSATDDLDSVLKVLALLVGINTLMVVKAHYSGVYQPGGVFPHRNGMAMAMLLLGPVFFALFMMQGTKTKSGKTGLALAGAAALSTLWSYSRGAMAMIPVAYGMAAFFCWLSGGKRREVFRRVLPMVAIGVIALLVALPRIIDRFVNAPESSGKTRIELAACAREMIMDKPLTGVGINNWSLNMEPTHPYQMDAFDKLGDGYEYQGYRGIVETVYLLVCAECGIPALAAMLIWFLWYWISCFRLLKRLRGTRWFFIPAGLLGGLTANYLQSALEWVLRQQLNLICVMFLFALISYLNVNWRRIRSRDR